jgi:GMP synthase (glutamine-hydrolysing)
MHIWLNRETSMIIVVDFGSQTTHLIGRRLRDMGIAYRIIEPEHALDAITRLKPQGLIFSGGPASVYTKGAPTIDTRVITSYSPFFVLKTRAGSRNLAFITSGF